MGWVEAIVMVIVMVLAVTSALLSMLLRPKAMPPVPGSADSIEVPIAQEGTSVRAIFGQILIKNATVAWYGDVTTYPIPYDGSANRSNKK
jgi:hypothetical protein